MDPKEVNLAGTMLVKSLSEIEELAEEIMADKEQVLIVIARIKSFFNLFTLVNQRIKITFILY